MYSNGCFKRFLVAGSLFDEESGQGTEDKCLDAATEPVEVEAGDGGDADGQPGVAGAQVGDGSQNAQHAENNTDNKGELLAALAENNDHAAADDCDFHIFSPMK